MSDENPLDIVEHDHGGRKHTHAWGSVPHSHLMRSVCLRDECRGWPTHDIHSDGKVRVGILSCRIPEDEA